MEMNSYNIIEEIKKGNVDFNDPKIRAAYALNLCTVSVSQIIDYHDVVILEQEYDAILNNLNIGMMPKDEALLKILKQLLDTITHFRLQEGDKKFIDLEYQNTMKNAIRNAIPNPGLLVAGRNPVTMAFSLASQVGIGYMNYRRCKTENTLAYEKEQWQLCRTAIEQFNGLRRELFDTAWRLVDVHEIPDKFCLTERQITQYNDILMDADYARRYERLESIQSNFVAYPPFWYFFGNAANILSASSDAEEADYYRMRAKMYYEISIRLFKACDLQRENQLASSCALEYIDLLDPNTARDKNKITELISYAVAMAGNANDVLQLCAFAYMKNGDHVSAASVLRSLINEGYNTIVNSQLLSSYYVSAYVAGDRSARVRYRYLSDRIDERYLFPMPDQQLLTAGGEAVAETMQARFLSCQKKILANKFAIVLQLFREKYRVKFNRCIPVPGEKSYPDAYYLNNAEAFAARLADGLILKKSTEIVKYAHVLAETDYPYNYLAVMNEMCRAVSLLDCMQGSESEMVVSLSKNIIAQNDILINVRDAVAVPEQCRLTYIVYQELLEISYDDFTGEFFTLLNQRVWDYISRRDNVTAMNIAEDNLREFCIAQGFDSPEDLYESSNDLDTAAEIEKKYLGPELIDDGDAVAVLNDKFKTVKETVQKAAAGIEIDPAHCSLLLSGSEAFDYYFANLGAGKTLSLRRKTVAVLDDKTDRDHDLLLTTEGLVQSIRGKIKEVIAYDNIPVTPDYNGLWLHQLYSNSNIYMTALVRLVLDLRENKDAEIRYSAPAF